MLLRTTRSDAPLIAASAAIAITGMLIARNGESLSLWPMLAAGCAAAAVIIAPRIARHFAADDETLDISPWGVRHHLGDALHESVGWRELSEVLVMTSAGDRDEEDMFILLRGRNENTVVIPHTLAVESGIISELRSRLSNFDDLVFADALSDRSNNMFVVWRAPDEAPVTEERSRPALLALTN
ncbi:MAG: hypothetical protein IT355_06275 [Gemmatimonadaceae bacterium]|nr:hypothetical protein [Gemmatimonadaceae bacterium]